MKKDRVVTYTLYEEEDGFYDDNYTASWEVGKSWVRFGGPEFQITITKEAAEKLKGLVDEFLRSKDEV